MKFSFFLDFRPNLGPKVERSEKLGMNLPKNWKKMKISKQISYRFFVLALTTLKVEIFACTYFRGYLFSRGFIFAIGILSNFAVTNFREFHEITNFQLFREDLILRISRTFSKIAKICLAKISPAKISTHENFYLY